MKLRRGAGWLLYAALGATIVATVWVVAGSAAPAGPSVLSRGPDGWIGARRYLESRGCTVDVVDREVDAADAPTVVVTAFPWQRFALDSAIKGLTDFARRGGTLVVGHTGNPDDLMQADLHDRLGLRWENVRGEPPLSPWAWKRFVTDEWSLDVNGPLRPGRLTASKAVPTPPGTAIVLATYGSGPARGRAAAFVFPFHEGTVVVLPAEALSNARLDNPGNADLLERLVHELGIEWSFDEYDHGLVGREELARAESPLALDLFLLHLLILYLLGVYFLGRRFGPPWTDRPASTGSTSSFLLGLGSLHDRLGHHREAARLLLSRVRALEPRVNLPGSFDRRAETAGRDEMVRIAREVAGLREGKDTR